MQSLGIVVLRFRNDEVMRELNAVIGKIVDVIEDLSPPPIGKGGDSVKLYSDSSKRVIATII